MQIKKPKRLVNEENKKLIKSLPCSVCGMYGPSDVDHIKTRGSGGGDSLGNLQSLCRRHHTEKGAIGVKTFFKKYGTTINRNRKKWELPEIIID
jgi:5-methylcytosine-specific restriction endonuclease McrA